jgi:hypothetical protein
MSFNTDEFLVNVPFLNPGTRPGTPIGVRFLNPGVPAPGGDELWFRPENLPMAEPVVKAMLDQFAQLARESKNVSDISAFAQYEDPYAHSSFAIRDEILAAQSGSQREIAAGEARSKAQTELCLAWALEEVALELDGLQKKFGGQWSTFERSLGLHDEDFLLDQELDLNDRDSLEGADMSLKNGETARNGKKSSPEGEEILRTGTMPEFVPSLPRVSTAVLVDAVLAFLPLGCGLYCADKDLRADWEEFGVVFTSAAPESIARFGLTGSFRQASAPGYLLCRSKRPDPAKPWLDGPRLIVVPGQEAGPVKE